MTGNIVGHAANQHTLPGSLAASLQDDQIDVLPLSHLCNDKPCFLATLDTSISLITHRFQPADDFRQVVL